MCAAKKVVPHSLVFQSDSDYFSSDTCCLIVISSDIFDANLNCSSKCWFHVEFNRAIEYLHAHLDDKITIESMARAAHLSASHFARVFKKETGKAPMEYVHGLRLERAKKC